MRIDVELEEWNGSPVIHPRRVGYRRKPARDFTDPAARLTPRQAVFYRNLVRLAEVIESSIIPVEFEIIDRPVFLDRGCIKIAERAGFLRPLTNGPSGSVEVVELAWVA